MTPPARHAALALRIGGCLIFCLGAWLALANILQTWQDFDPSYLFYYVESQLLKPLLGCIFGLLLIALAKPLGRLLATGLKE